MKVENDKFAFPPYWCCCSCWSIVDLKRRELRTPGGNVPGNLLRDTHCCAVCKCTETHKLKLHVPPLTARGMHSHVTHAGGPRETHKGRVVHSRLSRALEYNNLQGREWAITRTRKSRPWGSRNISPIRGKGKLSDVLISRRVGHLADFLAFKLQLYPLTDMMI